MQWKNFKIMIFMGPELMLNGQKLVEDTLAEMIDVEARHVVLIRDVAVAIVETVIEAVIDTDETVIMIETVIETAIETVTEIETVTIIEIVIKTVIEIVTVIETVTEIAIETEIVAMIEETEIKNVNAVVIMVTVEIENHQKIVKITINQTVMENLTITTVIEKKQTTIVLTEEVKIKKKKTTTNPLTDYLLTFSDFSTKITSSLHFYSLSHVPLLFALIMRSEFAATFTPLSSYP
jgi:hypothetical protein